MSPKAYRYVLMASVAGGFVGALVMWNRNRAQTVGASRRRQWAVLTLGTAAWGVAVFGITEAFSSCLPLYAATMIILITGWAAVLQSIVRLGVPATALRVRAGEFVVLSSPWIGVRWFGTCLRKTPLRHLGGRVFLSQVEDAAAVLRGLHDAELVHIWAVLFSLPWLLYWALRAEWTALGYGLAAHLPLNVYPILHLRYVTFRMERWAAKAREKQAPSVSLQ